MTHRSPEGIEPPGTAADRRERVVGRFASTLAPRSIIRGIRLQGFHDRVVVVPTKHQAQRTGCVARSASPRFSISQDVCGGVTCVRSDCGAELSADA